MRSTAKWILPVLIVLVAGLVVSVSAQKGKPAPTPVWSVTIDDGGDVFLPNHTLRTSSGVAVTGGYHVQNGCDGCQHSEFGVKVTGSTSTLDNRWIGFRNLVNESNTLQPSQYPQSCTYPPFVGGILQFPKGGDYPIVMLPDPTIPTDTRSCITEFFGTDTSGHQHPQYPYSWTVRTDYWAEEGISPRSLPHTGVNSTASRR